MFRFGNHQTLNSRHAILLPILDTWFRIAIVDGNTPFLLSSEFLRRTLKAIIDTEEGTIWSKTLQRSLSVEVNSKNLFLMDIAQLWSETEGHAQPVLSSQVQSAEALNHATEGEKLTSVKPPVYGHEKSKVVTADLSHEDFRSSSNFDFIPGTSRFHKGSNGECGPSSLVSDSSCLPSDFNQDGHHLAAFEGISPGEQASAGRGQPGNDSVDVFAGSQQRTDRIWSGQEGSIVHRGVQGPLLDGLVCGPLREV